MAKYRRGLGKGKGSGWKNIISNDPHRHNLSRMGVKSAMFPKGQKIPTNVIKFIQQNPESVKKVLKNETKLDQIDFNDDAVEVVRTPKGMVRIFQDDNPEDPREWDNLGKMFFFHKRYNLGDSHPETSNQFDSWDDIKKYLIKEKGAAVILPVYMYDHSGLRVKVGNFHGLLPEGHAEFDSGMIGFAYVSKDQIKENYGKVGKAEIQRAEKVLRGEVETYDQYLSGDVWSFASYDNSGKEIESVGGYYGMDSAIEAGKETL